MFKFWDHFLTVEESDGYSFKCKHCGEKVVENQEPFLTVGAMEGHFKARHADKLEESNVNTATRR